MKRIIVLLCAFIIIANCAYSQSIFQSQLDAHKNNLALDIGLCAGGAALLITSYALILASNPEDSGYWVGVTVFSITAGCGGGLGSYAGFYGIPRDIKNMKRLEYAKAQESVFTPEEIDAILNGNIFVGMTLPALISAWWYPERSNNASYGNQWAYENLKAVTKNWPSSDQYVYVADGVVTGWN